MVLRPEQGSFVSAYEILSVQVQNHVLSPAEAEVRLTFLLGGLWLGVEARGRLVGPRCVYASTVEVAYPLRMLSSRQAEGVTARVLIPEPSLWDPTCPFLYQGPVELWDERGLVRAWEMSHGLRWLQLAPGGLRWNGQPLTLHGVAQQELVQSDAAWLRQSGYNTLLAGLPQAARLADAADHLGFLMLVRVSGDLDSLPAARGLGDHACFLGWLLPQEMVEDESARAAAIVQLGDRPGALLGVELSRPVPEEMLAGIAFIGCRAELLPALAQVRRPRVVLTTTPAAPVPAGPNLLGSIHL
jgi:hypothetical protein